MTKSWHPIAGEATNASLPVVPQYARKYTKINNPICLISYFTVLFTVEIYTPDFFSFLPPPTQNLESGLGKAISAEILARGGMSFGLF